MDPDANLKEQLELADEINAAFDAIPDDEDDLTIDNAFAVASKAARLAELIRGLDQWLLKKGFKPKRWRDT